jgi:hypothetical protein
VFRHHVGLAMLESGRWPHQVASWDADRPVEAGARAAEAQLEVAVSEYIRALSFVVVPVDDSASPNSRRGVIERGAIGLLAAAARVGLIRASDQWLGLSARRREIRDSMLWNVNHVYESHSPAFLSAMESALE